MEQPWAYRLWQSPFAGQKLGPVLELNDFQTIRSVLDVGCGPGTNAPYFRHTAYVGIDINPRYIESARRHHAGHFQVGDVTEFEIDQSEFDFILANSLFHHLDDSATLRVLRRLSELLSADGHIHILDLVRPERGAIARSLARWDRGDYTRPLERWRAIFEEHFATRMFEPYPVGGLGITMWNMVYFKGAKRA